jgi:hypothetical protein
MPAVPEAHPRIGIETTETLLVRFCRPDRKPCSALVDAAVLDPLAHHAITVNVCGDSERLREKLEPGAGPDTNRQTREGATSTITRSAARSLQCPPPAAALGRAGRGEGR